MDEQTKVMKAAKAVPHIVEALALADITPLSVTIRSTGTVELLTTPAMASAAAFELGAVERVVIDMPNGALGIERYSGRFFGETPVAVIAVLGDGTAPFAGAAAEAVAR